MTTSCVCIATPRARRKGDEIGDDVDRGYAAERTDEDLPHRPDQGGGGDCGSCGTIARDAVGDRRGDASATGSGSGVVRRPPPRRRSRRAGRKRVSGSSSPRGEGLHAAPTRAAALPARRPPIPPPRPHATASRTPPSPAPPWSRSACTPCRSRRPRPTRRPRWTGLGSRAWRAVDRAAQIVVSCASRRACADCGGRAGRVKLFISFRNRRAAVD